MAYSIEDYADRWTSPTGIVKYKLDRGVVCELVKDIK